MILKESEGLRWHEFTLLADQPLIHATLTRHGGFSSGELASLNLGCSVGDLSSNIDHNLHKVKQVLRIPKLSLGKLAHGSNICQVSSQTPTYGLDPIADGRSTQQPHLGLLMTHADCQAAIFYDPIQHALANVHCGWRGNVQNIYAVAVSHMRQRYGSKPQNLLVCISPSLGPEHAQFINYQTELPESFWEYQVKPFFFDLWAISKAQLLAAGVLAQHIEIASIDTYACSADYFSYRRSKQSGRQATVCALLPK